MTTGQMDLFSMNAHGDLWQEPSLFDAPAEILEPAHPGRIHFLEEVRPPVENAEGRWRLQSHCDACGADFSTTAADSLDGAWRTVEAAHDARRAVTGD